MKLTILLELVYRSHPKTKPLIENAILTICSGMKLFSFRYTYFLKQFNFMTLKIKTINLLINWMSNYLFFLFQFDHFLLSLLILCSFIKFNLAAICASGSWLFLQHFNLRKFSLVECNQRLSGSSVEWTEICRERPRRHERLNIVLLYNRMNMKM